MRSILMLLVAAMLVASPARAQSTAQGGGALAVAALVGANAPQVVAADKAALAALINGHVNISYPAGKTIAVTADGVVCQAGDVNIAAHSCVLTFGKATVNLAGRKAHELFATIVELGVPPDGAAGRSYEALSHLNCVVDPNRIKQQDGGGASCQFTPGSP
jgi:hypothetical protein